MKRLTAVCSIAMLVFAGVALCVPASFAGSNYIINDYIFLGPDQSQQREFKVYDVFSLRDLSPVEAFVVVATGEAGTLSVSLSASPQLAFGERLDYTLFGFGYSLDEGPFFIYKSATTPYSISAEATIESAFGFAFLGIIINDYVGDDNMIFPCPFTVSFSLSESAAADEG